MKISVSILEFYKNTENLEQKLSMLEQSSCDFLHLDIMDGKFVPEKTWTYSSLKPLVENSRKKLDVHIMVEDVMGYIQSLLPLKPTILTFHTEAISSIDTVISFLHEHHILAGVSIKPGTPIDMLYPYLDKIDLVLVMSVEPGKGGQTFLESSIDKIEQLKKIREENGFHYLIEVDGGINALTIEKVQSADIAVVGSFITKSQDYESQISCLRKL